MNGQIVVIRHGETAWSLSGQHTSVTDVPLTDAGRAAARALAPTLAAMSFTRVLSSPRLRATETCELAGLGDRMEIEPDLVEWSYGEYEGLTQDEIQRRAPGWQLFTDGGPGGESPAQVSARVDRLIANLRATDGTTAVFSHGHILRVVASRWIGLPVASAASLLLDTATLGILGYYRDVPAIARWNAPVQDPSRN